MFVELLTSSFILFALDGNRKKVVASKLPRKMQTLQDKIMNESSDTWYFSLWGYATYIVCYVSKHTGQTPTLLRVFVITHYLWGYHSKISLTGNGKYVQYNI